MFQITDFQVAAEYDISALVIVFSRKDIQEGCLAAPVFGNESDVLVFENT